MRVTVKQFLVLALVTMFSGAPLDVWPDDSAPDSAQEKQKDLPDPVGAAVKFFKKFIKPSDQKKSSQMDPYATRGGGTEPSEAEETAAGANDVTTDLPSEQATGTQEPREDNSRVVPNEMSARLQKIDLTAEGSRNNVSFAEYVAQLDEKANDSNSSTWPVPHKFSEFVKYARGAQVLFSRNGNVMLSVADVAGQPTQEYRLWRVGTESPSGEVRESRSAEDKNGVLSKVSVTQFGGFQASRDSFDHIEEKKYDKCRKEGTLDACRSAWRDGHNVYTHKDKGFRSIGLGQVALSDAGDLLAFAFRNKGRTQIDVAIYRTSTGELAHDFSFEIGPYAKYFMYDVVLTCGIAFVPKTQDLAICHKDMTFDGNKQGSGGVASYNDNESKTFRTYHHEPFKVSIFNIEDGTVKAQSQLMGPGGNPINGTNAAFYPHFSMQGPLEIKPNGDIFIYAQFSCMQHLNTSAWKGFNAFDKYGLPECPIAGHRPLILGRGVQSIYAGEDLSYRNTDAIERHHRAFNEVKKGVEGYSKLSLGGNYERYIFEPRTDALYPGDVWDRLIGAYHNEFPNAFIEVINNKATLIKDVAYLSPDEARSGLELSEFPVDRRMTNVRDQNRKCEKRSNQEFQTFFIRSDGSVADPPKLTNPYTDSTFVDVVCAGEIGRLQNILMAGYDDGDEESSQHVWLSYITEREEHEGVLSRLVFDRGRYFRDYYKYLDENLVYLTSTDEGLRAIGRSLDVYALSINDERRWKNNERSVVEAATLGSKGGFHKKAQDMLYEAYVDEASGFFKDLSPLLTSRSLLSRVLCEPEYCGVDFKNEESLLPRQQLAQLSARISQYRIDKYGRANDGEGADEKQKRLNTLALAYLDYIAVASYSKNVELVVNAFMRLKPTLESNSFKGDEPAARIGFLTDMLLANLVAETQGLGAAYDFLLESRTDSKSSVSRYLTSVSGEDFKREIFDRGYFEAVPRLKTDKKKFCYLLMPDNQFLRDCETNPVTKIYSAEPFDIPALRDVDEDKSSEAAAGSIPATGDVVDNLPTQPAAEVTATVSEKSTDVRAGESSGDVNEMVARLKRIDLSADDPMNRASFSEYVANMKTEKKDLDERRYTPRVQVLRGHVGDTRIVFNRGGNVMLTIADVEKQSISEYRLWRVVSASETGSDKGGILSEADVKQFGGFQARHASFALVRPEYVEECARLFVKCSAAFENHYNVQNYNQQRRIDLAQVALSDPGDLLAFAFRNKDRTRIDVAVYQTNTGELRSSFSVEVGPYAKHFIHDVVLTCGIAFVPETQDLAICHKDMTFDGGQKKSDGLATYLDNESDAFRAYHHEPFKVSIFNIEDGTVKAQSQLMGPGGRSISDIAAGMYPHFSMHGPLEIKSSGDIVIDARFSCMGHEISYQNGGHDYYSQVTEGAACGNGNYVPLVLSQGVQSLYSGESLKYRNADMLEQWYGLYTSQTGLPRWEDYLAQAERTCVDPTKRPRCLDGAGNAYLSALNERAGEFFKGKRRLRDVIYIRQAGGDFKRDGVGLFDETYLSAIQANGAFESELPIKFQWHDAGRLLPAELISSYQDKRKEGLPHVWFAAKRGAVGELFRMVFDGDEHFLDYEETTNEPVIFLNEHASGLTVIDAGLKVYTLSIDDDVRWQQHERSMTEARLMYKKGLHDGAIDMLYGVYTDEGSGFFNGVSPTYSKASLLKRILCHQRSCKNAGPKDVWLWMRKGHLALLFARMSLYDIEKYSRAIENESSEAREVRLVKLAEGYINYALVASYAGHPALVGHALNELKPIVDNLSERLGQANAGVDAQYLRYLQQRWQINNFHVGTRGPRVDRDSLADAFKLIEGLIDMLQANLIAQSDPDQAYEFMRNSVNLKQLTPLYQRGYFESVSLLPRDKEKFCDALAVKAWKMNCAAADIYPDGPFDYLDLSGGLVKVGAAPASVEPSQVEVIKSVPEVKDLPIPPPARDENPVVEVLD